MKSACIRRFSRLYFPTLGLNTERYGVFLFSPNAELYRPENFKYGRFLQSESWLEHMLNFSKLGKLPKQKIWLRNMLVMEVYVCFVNLLSCQGIINTIVSYLDLHPKGPWQTRTVIYELKSGLCNTHIFNSNYVSAESSQVFQIGGTAQKMKFSIKDFFSQCDQIRRKRWNVVKFNLKNSQWKT